MDSKIILGRILQIFIDKGISKHQGYNSFGYISHSSKSITLSRENGKDTIVPFDKIIIGIEAYIENNDLYTEGPGVLRNYGITHITSPVFSLLHLLLQKDYQI